MPRLAFILALLTLLPACREFEQAFLSEETPIDPCDPTSSTYDGYVHFIERDFLTEDGTLDYRKWFEASRAESSDCDPLRVRERQSADLPPAPGVAPAPPAMPEPPLDTSSPLAPPPEPAESP